MKRSKMCKISIISAIDGSEWGQFLRNTVLKFGSVVQCVVSKNDELRWTEINQEVICIILSPHMLRSNKQFLQKSMSYLKNPIVVLCGVSPRELSEAFGRKLWKQYEALTITTDEETIVDFQKTVQERVTKREKLKKAIDAITDSNDITIIPETIDQKADQSCVLIFPKPVPGEVEISIQGQRKKLIATQKDTKTYVFNVPELTAGNYKLDIYVTKILIPVKVSLKVISSNPKCPCDYICQMLGSERLHSLDKALTESMEDDYSNRLFYQNIHKRNPDFPEYPTVLHFASKHGMYGVLQHLLSTSRAREGLSIRNSKDMDCLDLARSSGSSTDLVPFLEKECYADDDLYMDMTQNLRYSDSMRNSN